MSDLLLNHDDYLESRLFQVQCDFLIPNRKAILGALMSNTKLAKRLTDTLQSTFSTEPVQPMARPLRRLLALQWPGCKAGPVGSSSRLRTGFYSLRRSAESSRVQTQRDRVY